MKFTPSPTKLVRFLNQDGTISEIHMNRAERRRLGIKGLKAPLKDKMVREANNK